MLGCCSFFKIGCHDRKSEIRPKRRRNSSGELMLPDESVGERNVSALNEPAGALGCKEDVSDPAVSGLV